MLAKVNQPVAQVAADSIRTVRCIIISFYLIAPDRPRLGVEEHIISLDVAVHNVQVKQHFQSDADIAQVFRQQWRCFLHSHVCFRSGERRPDINNYGATSQRHALVHAHGLKFGRLCKEILTILTAHAPDFLKSCDSFRAQIEAA